MNESVNYRNRIEKEPFHEGMNEGVSQLQRNTIKLDNESSKRMSFKSTWCSWPGKAPSVECAAASIWSDRAEN